jgi:hypothetical protein
MATADELRLRALAELELEAESQRGPSREEELAYLAEQSKPTPIDPAIVAREGEIRPMSLTEEYPLLSDVVRGTGAGLGGLAGAALTSPTVVGTLAGAGAGGAAGQVIADSVLQGVDALYDQYRGYESAPLRNPASVSNLAEGAVSGVINKGMDVALKPVLGAAGEAMSRGMTDVGNRIGNTPIANTISNIGSGLEDLATQGRARMFGARTRTAWEGKDPTSQFFEEGGRSLKQTVEAKTRIIESDPEFKPIFLSQGGVEDWMQGRVAQLEAAKKAEIAAVDSELAAQSGNITTEGLAQKLAQRLNADARATFTDSNIGNAPSVVLNDILTELGDGPVTLEALDRAKSKLYRQINFRDPNANAKNRAYLTGARALKDSINEIYEGVMGRSVTQNGQTVYGVKGGSNLLTDILEKESAYIEMMKLAEKQAAQGNATGSPLVQSGLRSAIGAASLGSLASVVGAPVGAGVATGLALNSTLGRGITNSAVSALGGAIKSSPDILLNASRTGADILGSGMMAAGRQGLAEQAINPQASVQDLSAILDPNQQQFIPNPRNLVAIKSDPNSAMNVGFLAQDMGLLQSPEELMSMPDDIAQKVVGAVAAANPRAFESNPDMANVIDDKYQDPMSRDRVVMSSMDLEPRERAMRIGASFTNKYVPPTAPMTPMQPPMPALPATLSQLSENLEPLFLEQSRPAQDYSYDQSNLVNLEKLTNGSQ